MWSRFRQKSKARKQLVADQFAGYPDVVMHARNELAKYPEVEITFFVPQWKKIAN